MSAWQPSELVKLKQLAGQGLSAGLIAAQLNRQFGNGRSRSAVLGKIHRGRGRYGQLSQQPGFRLDGKPHAKPGPKPGSVKASLGRTGDTGAAAAAATPVERLDTSRAGGAPAGRATMPAARSGVRPSADAHLPATRPIRFLDALFSDRCLHFVGDPFAPSGPDMPVCGAERAQGVLGTRYCCRHLASQHRARDAA